MMRRHGSHLAAGLALLFSASKTAPAQRAEPVPLAGRVVLDTIYSRGLEGNLLGDAAAQAVAVYLPPAYANSAAQRFPVIYLLPPGDGSSTTWTRAWPRLFGPRAGVEVMDSAFATVKQMIIVMPNGRNRYRASFFINSPVTGAWEDFVVRDVVGHVDAKYRTLADAASRGVAGHSMGGNASILLAMRHPDVFGAVYALSACCLAGGLELFPDGAWQRLLSYRSLDQLDTAFRAGDFPAMMLMAMAAAITPSTKRPPFYADLPYEVVDGALRHVQPAYSKWVASTPLAQVPAREPALRQLRAIRLDYGTLEMQGLVSGNRRFADALAASRIPHVLEVYAGNHHNRVMERLASQVLPFFAEFLVFSAPAPR